MGLSVRLRKVQASTVRYSDQTPSRTEQVAQPSRIGPCGSCLTGAGRRAIRPHPPALPFRKPICKDGVVGSTDRQSPVNLGDRYASQD